MARTSAPARRGAIGERLSRRLAAIATMAFLAASGAAGATLDRAILPNGLEILVAENHAVPLATVCVVFRGGASAQSPETAGLFHLYEHMLFDGNEKYPTQAEFTAALARMGVTNWNGGTGTAYIDYFINVPSSKLAEGIEFWSWAVRRPVFDADKLEREKRVVLNEIRAYHVDPDRIAKNALESRIFPDYPWRKNIDGPEAVVSAATVAQLEEMRRSFYIPRNAALLVGGDVEAETVFELAASWFGDWSGGPAPIFGEPPQGGLPEGIALVYPDEDFYRGVAGAYLRWRGPDSLGRTADLYVSDVLSGLLSSPVGKFKSALMGAGLGLYDPEYLSFGYPAERDGGNYRLSAFLSVGAAPDDLIDRVEALRAAAIREFSLIAEDPEAYFGALALEKAKAKLVDRNLLAEEVASSFVTRVLAFWWAVASTDDYLDYERRCGMVSWDDIGDLIRRYLLNSASAVEVRIRADAYASAPALAERGRELGYVEIGPHNAFWWQGR